MNTLNAQIFNRNQAPVINNSREMFRCIADLGALDFDFSGRGEPDPIVGI
jgi:hypothetical protein